LGARKSYIVEVEVDVCLSLSQSVSLMIASPAKTAEPIEMPFGVWTRVGPKKHVLDGVQVPHAKGKFEGKMGGPL